MKHTRKKTLTFLFLLTLLFALLSLTASAEDYLCTVTTAGGTTTYFSDFSAAVSSSNWPVGSTLKLLGDVSANFTVPSGAHILDLNGHGITSAASETSIVSIPVGAELTLNDSDPSAAHSYSLSGYLATVGSGDKTFYGGYITGGYSTVNIGAVDIYGTFTMNAGVIIGNNCDKGAVFVRYDRSFTGVFNMSGGGIIGNDGGMVGAVNLDGQCSMSGGSITGNHGGFGGGMYEGPTGVFNMSGGSITGNNSNMCGGVVVLGTISVSGSPVINGNTGVNGNNVLLAADKIITVTGTLTSRAELWVTKLDPTNSYATTGVFTSGLNGRGNASCFKSDSGDYMVTLSSGGEAQLGLLPSIYQNVLELNGVLNLKYYLALPDGFDGTGASMTFTMPYRDDQVVPFSDSTSEGGYQVFPCGVYGYQMADTITATFRYQTSNGEKTLTDSYSVKDYLDDVESASGGSAATLALVNATRNYGHYVQPYLSRLQTGVYQTEMAAASTVDIDTARTGSKTEADKHQKNTSIDNNLVSRVRFRLNVNTGTDLVFELFPTAGLSGDVDVVITAGSTTLESYSVGLTDGVYRVAKHGIAANNLEVPYTFTVSKNGTTVFQTTASPMDYISTALTKSTAEDEKTTLAALYEYWQAAEAYGTP